MSEAQAAAALHVQIIAQSDTPDERGDNNAVRLSLKTINAELAKRCFNARLERGDGYFYFQSGEAADWLDGTVRVPTLHSLTLDQWAGEFLKLREKNRQLMKSVGPAKSNAKRTQPKGGK